MQEINKNIMTIKIIIPYQQWMKYGEDKCMGCRKNEYGDIYFVTDILFLLFIRRFNSPIASFSYIVNIMKEHDQDDATMGDMSLYFDFESRGLFHDRELNDKAIILYLMPTCIFDELRDRISLFSNTMALVSNILFMEHCGINGHIALLGKIKRIAELLIVEKRQKENINDKIDILGWDTFAMCSDIRVEDEHSVFFATSPFQTPIVTIW